jgi:hypothetical protein
VDSEFVNAEARYEWYFAPEERLSVAAFYKNIDKPIEAYTGFNDNTPVTSFANAPEAVLYGAEFELTKYFSLDELFDGCFFGARRAVVVGNYTYTSSDIKVGERRSGSLEPRRSPRATTVDGQLAGGPSVPAVRGVSGGLSQRTVCRMRAPRDPSAWRPADIFESPGLRRTVAGALNAAARSQLKFEVRNIFGRGYRESERGGNIVYWPPRRGRRSLVDHRGYIDGVKPAFDRVAWRVRRPRPTCAVNPSQTGARAAIAIRHTGVMDCPTLKDMMASLASLCRTGSISMSIVLIHHQADGSTVYPVTEAVGRAFQVPRAERAHAVGISGTRRIQDSAAQTDCRTFAADSCGNRSLSDKRRSLLRIARSVRRDHGCREPPEHVGECFDCRPASQDLGASGRA